MTGLFISNLQTNPAFFFAVVITVVVSITLHELAHGFAAVRLGDDTPIHTGHMTLNPLVHMGGLSLVLLAVAGIAFGAMPVDRTRLRGKYAESLMAAAGPATNFALALLALTALAMWERFATTPYGQWSPPMANGKFLLMIFGLYNLMLGVFNLLPVPPLDGGWIAANLFPAYRRFLNGDLARGAMTAVFFALFIGAGVFIYRGASDVTYRFLTGVSGRNATHFEIIQYRLTVQRPDYFNGEYLDSLRRDAGSAADRDDER